MFCLVHELTNPSKGLGCARGLRKCIDRLHHVNLSRGAVFIKLADRADNLRGLTGAGVEFRMIYLAESKALYDVLLKARIESPAYAFYDLCGDFEAALNSPALNTTS